jgi:hypothetical protein
MVHMLEWVQGGEPSGMMPAEDPGVYAGAGFDYGFAEGMGVDLVDAAQGGNGDMEDKDGGYGSPIASGICSFRRLPVSTTRLTRMCAVPMRPCSVHQRAGKRQTKPNPKYEDDDEPGKGVGTPRGGVMPGTPSGKQEHPMTPVMTSKSGKGAFHGKGGMLLTPRSGSGGKGAVSAERLGTPASGGSSHKKKQQRGDSSSGWGSEEDHSPSYRTSHKKKRNYSNMSSPEDGEGGKRKYSKKGSSSAERRSKHHNPWSQQEAEALVEGVAVCGGGKWADIKKLGYPAISNRSAVDLKDKWRNLLRIALLPNPPTPKVSQHASLHPSCLCDVGACIFRMETSQGALRSLGARVGP